VPQLRQDPTTKEWVIIAAERSKRPHDFKKIESAIEKPTYKEDCPFCPGNEHLTPHETLAYRKGGPPDSKGWWVRVIPKEHQASFGLISMEDSKTFAKVLKTVLFKLYSKLNNPDYNFIIHTAPIKDEGEDYYHWHLQIIPRLTTPAGFEMGSGIYINVSFPEETAQFLREG